MGITTCSNYDSIFDNQNGAAETVVLVHRRDRPWRIAGYFVK